MTERLGEQHAAMGGAPQQADEAVASEEVSPLIRYSTDARRIVMKHHTLPRTFIIFHFTLGVVVLIQSVGTVLHSIDPNDARPPHAGLAAFAAAEAVAALLFLIPATMRLAGATLLLIFGVALVIHGLRGEIPLTLFVYAAGVAFVMAHGSAFGRGASFADNRFEPNAR